MKTLPLLALLAACASEPTSCDEADCDPAAAYCLFFGSDTPAPGTASCQPYPAACAEAPDCACLLAEHEPIATCDDGAGGFEVTIPGG